MKKKSLKYWAQVSEIIAGVAVIITLIFLIFEVRENSDLVRADSFNRSIESLVEWRSDIATNDAALKVMAEHFDFDDPEALRQQMLVVNLWSIYEKTYYSQQYGLVGPAEWERFQTRICSYQRSAEGFWDDRVAVFLTEEFRDYVVASCRK
jgi:hypothetical protein